MTRTAFFVACVSVLCLGGQAAADPVTITSGSIVLPEAQVFQLGPIAIAGTRGFSIDGSVDSGEGRFDPPGQCFPCVPRADFSLEAVLSGSAISGEASLDGTTYNDINTLTSNNFAYLHLIGTSVLPPVNRSSLVLSAPFTIAGDSFFRHEVTPGSSPEFAQVILAGRGMVTMSFVADESSDVWNFSGMRYEFGPTAHPVLSPEPATLVLVGGGIAAKLLRARTRRRRSYS